MRLTPSRDAGAASRLRSFVRQALEPPPELLGKPLKIGVIGGRCGACGGCTPGTWFAASPGLPTRPLEGSRDLLRMATLPCSISWGQAASSRGTTDWFSTFSRYAVSANPCCSAGVRSCKGHPSAQLCPLRPCRHEPFRRPTSPHATAARQACRPRIPCCAWS